MDDRTQRVADEIASIEAISHNTVKALSTVTTPLNVIIGTSSTGQITKATER